MPDRSTAYLSVERARRLSPKLVVIARAVTADQVGELSKLGVDAVVQPEFEGGVEMLRQALTRYQADEAATARLLSEVRIGLYGGTDRPGP